MRTIFCTTEKHAIEKFKVSTKYMGLRNVDLGKYEKYTINTNDV